MKLHRESFSPLENLNLQEKSTSEILNQLTNFKKELFL